MATVVNNPPAENNSSGVGFIIGALILLFAVFVFIYYGLPAMRNAASSSSPSITVPDQIDVNVNNGGESAPPAQ